MYFIYTTFSSKGEAKKATLEIIKKRLAGCVNIFPIESIYKWKGKIAEDKEVVAIFKTTKKKLSKLQKEIKRLHTYKTPCIASIKISKINKEYLSWLRGEVK